MVLEVIVEIAKGLGLLSLLALGFIFVRSHDTVFSNKLRSESALGLIFGLLIAAVMIDPIRITEGATLDARGGPAILAGIFGGPLAALISAAIGSLVRLYVQGGPLAMGGVVGFVLYGAFGAAAGYFLPRSNPTIGIRALVLIGLAGTIAVLPAFFINADFLTGISILKKAGPILLFNNLIGTIIVGLILSRADKWVELKKQLALEESENARLAVIARETNTGVVITDQKGETEWVNRAFETLSGYSSDEVLGKKPGDLLQGKNTDKTTVARISRAIVERQPFNEELLNYTKSGEPYWIQIYCEPFKEADGTEKFLAIETDITARKEAEKLKSQFLSVVNHELRTPLTAILGSIGLMRSGKLGDIPTPAMNLLNIAEQNSERLLQIVNDILDFEKLNSGNMEFQFERLDLVGLARDAIKVSVPYAEKHGVTLSLDLGLDSLFVLGDPRRLSQVLSNFISNACKFAPAGSSVSVTVSQRNEKARIEVIDLGPGIPVDKRKKIFERFTQVDSTDTRSVGGTGLGLSIVKSIVEGHGGEVGVEPNTPTGSIFFFELAVQSQEGG